MYCTIDTPDTSTGQLDAQRSLAELARHARSLGALSANASRHARQVAQAYRQALFAAEAPAPAESWRRFVTSAEHLLETADAIHALGSLRSGEVAARAFFRQIVEENRDLRA